MKDSVMMGIIIAGVKSIFTGCSLQTQLLLAFLIYLRPLHYEKRPLYQRIVSVMLLYAGSIFFTFATLWLISGTNLTGIADTGRSLPVVLAFSMSSYLMSVLCAWSFRYMDFLEAVYVASCSYLTQHFTRCLYMLLSNGQAENGSDYLLLQWICIIFVYGGCYLWFAKNLMENGEKQRRSRQGLTTTLAALAMAIFLSAIAQQIADQSRSLYSICMIYGMVCCFYVLWDQAARKNQQFLQNELDMQQQIFQKYKDQYQMSQENVALINRKCHDLKHQIAALRHVNSEEQRNEQIHSLEKSVMIYDSMVRTDNEVLDTLLTEKSLFCEEHGITLTCVCDGKAVAFMDPVDIYTIFGNALDNALECVSKFEDPEKRIISVILTSRANMVLFQFENYFEQQLVMTGDGYATTKDQDGYHGFGLKSIRYAAEKYGGFMKVEAEGGIFLLRVMVPVKN